MRFPTSGRQIRVAVGLTVVVGGFALICCLPALLDAMARRVDPSEKEIASRITGLGGSFQARRLGGGHIVHVWLDDTAATDEDVIAILDLPKIESLNLARTHLTDRAAAEICRHRAIRSVDLTGIAVSEDVLQRMFDRKITVAR